MSPRVFVEDVCRTKSLKRGGCADEMLVSVKCLQRLWARSAFELCGGSGINCSCWIVVWAVSASARACRYA